MVVFIFLFILYEWVARVFDEKIFQFFFYLVNVCFLLFSERLYWLYCSTFIFFCRKKFSLRLSLIESFWMWVWSLILLSVFFFYPLFFSGSYFSFLGLRVLFDFSFNKLFFEGCGCSDIFFYFRSGFGLGFIFGVKRGKIQLDLLG